MALHFKPPDQLDYNSAQEFAEKWDSWKREFESFMVSAEYENKADKIKVNMFLNLIGQKGRDLYDTLTFDVDGDKLKLNKVLEKFDKHAKPNKCVTINRQIFFHCKQAENQTVRSALTRYSKIPI